MPQVDAKVKLGMEFVSDDLQNKVKKQAKKAGEAIQNEANKGAKKITFGQKIKGEFQKIKKGIEAVGISGDKLGKIGEFLSAGGKLGMLAAGFAILGKQISDMWDRATLSAEEYAKKQELRLKDSAEKVQKTQQRQSEDNSYFARLIELSKVEKMNLEQKQEAIQIIDILNGRYKNLGLTIDSVTGSILGLSMANAQIKEDQKRQMLENLWDQVKDIQSLAYLRLTQAFVELNKAWGSGYIDEIMFNNFGRVKGGVNDSLAYMQGLSTEQQIKILTFLRNKNAKTEEEIDRLQAVIELKKKQLDLERRIAKIKNQPTPPKNPRFVGVNQKTLRDLEAEADKYSNQAFESMHSQMNMEKAERFRSLKGDSAKIAWFKEEIELEKSLIQSYEAEIKKLQGKTYGVLDEQIKAEDAVKIAKLRALIAKSDKEILGYQIEIKKIQERSKNFYQDEKSNLDFELKLLKLKLQGKYEEIELLKLQNKIKRDGLIVDQKQIQAILAKQKAISKINANQAIKDQAISLMDSISTDDRNYQIQRKIEQIEKANSVKLTSSQKREVEMLYDLEQKIKKIQGLKLDLGSFDIKTNELTARGGFQTGAVMPDIISINTAIKNYSEKTANAIIQIKAILKNGWKI